MTSSRSRTAKRFVAIVAVLVAMTSAAYAGGRKRIVVLDFEGPKAERFHDDLVKMLKKSHTVVPTDKWNGVAEDMNAATLNEKNVKKVAKKLKVDGVISGKIEKRRDEYILRLKLREGKSGMLVGDGVETKAEGPRIDGGASKDIKDELIGAIDELEANHGGGAGGDDDGESKGKKTVAKKKAGGDDDDDGDVKPKKTAGKKKAGGDDDDDDGGSTKHGAFSKKSNGGRAADDDDAPAKTAKKTPPPKKTAAASDDDDDAPAKPAKKVPPPPKKTAAASDDDDDAPAKTAKKTPPPKKTAAPNDDDDVPAALKTKKTAPPPSDDDDGAAAKSKKTAAKKKAGGDDDEGDDDQPKKSSKKKKVARGGDDDDGSVRGGVDVGAPASAKALSVTSRAIDGTVGASFTARKLQFSYDSALANPPPSYNDGVPAPGVVVDITLYPLALGHKRKANDILNGIGFQVVFDRVLAINSQKQYVNQSNAAETVKLATTEQYYEFGPVFRYALGDKAIGARLMFTHQDFQISQTLPSDAQTGTTVDIPNVSYNAFTPSVFGHIPLTPKITGDADLGLVIVTSAGAGAYQLDNGQLAPGQGGEYGRSKKLGVELRIGGSYQLSRELFVRALLRFEQIGISFAADPTTMANNRDPSNTGTQSVFGAKDMYYGGQVSVGYLF